jgi:hypothetical protein
MMVIVITAHMMEVIAAVIKEIATVGRLTYVLGLYLHLLIS